MLRVGYSKGSLNFYKQVWEKLSNFALVQGENYFSEKLGIKFIEKYFNIFEKDSQATLSQSDVQHLRVVRMLGDYQLHGTILRRYYKHKKLLTNEYFINTLSEFKNYCIEQQYSPVTVSHYTKETEKLLAFVESQQILSCREVSLPLLHNYIRTLAGYTYKTVELILCSIRRFMHYLHLNDLIDCDYSTKLPMVQTRKQPRIPSVWSTEDLVKLISAIDRGSPLGKRDYAIILLACRLGLRVGDIKKLTFSNFNWENSELTFTQSKTKRETVLPLTHEVGWAVIDYLKYGRPDVDSPCVFIRHVAPFLPFSEGNHLSGMITRYMKKAHIPLCSGKKRGMHSLRHTLASLLLESDTPLPVISDILGHINTNSTAVYLKVDIKKLRECALDFEEEEIDE